MIGRALPSYWRLLAGFLVAACVYIFFLDPWGHDTWFHLQRLQDVERQFAWGHLRAYFAENVAQGKGLPVWIYYSQWVYWPAMILTSAGLSPLVALKFVYCLLLVVCCAGCYRLLRLHVDEGAAVFGTLLFMTSNYVIGEVFQRSAYAEFMSVALLPLLLVAIHGTVLREDRRSGTALVLIASLMILSHPLSFMNAGCALIAYAAYIGVTSRLPYGRFLRFVPLFALALGLTAFYWLPAVIETRFVRGAEGVPTPLSETFLSIGRYLKFSGITSLGFVLTLLTPVVAGCVLLRRRVQDVPAGRAWWPLLAAIVVYVLLTLRISEPLYTSLPLLASNLWVWRVLFPMILLVVIFVTVNLPALPPRLRGDTVLRGLAVLAVLQASALVLWNTAAELSIRPMDIRDIEARLAVESQFKDGFGIDEYLPQPRVLPRPPVECGAVQTMEPNGRYEMRFVIAPGDANACVHVPRYWNTRYAAWIDDRATPVYANADGEVLVAPGGRGGRLSLRFTKPGYVTLSTLLSGAAAFLLLIRFVPRARR